MVVHNNPMNKSFTGRPTPLQESLQLAVQHHTAGRLQEAEAIYRRILQSHPNEVNSLNLLGFLLHQCGDHRSAVTLIQKAVSLHPAFFDALNNLGVVLDASGKAKEAINAYRRAVALKPDYAAAHYNLGNVLHREGMLDEAIASYRRALHFKPDNPDVQCNLGNVLKDQGKLDEAISCYRDAIALKPEHPDAHNNLGSALRLQGKTDEAIARFQRAIELRPNYLEAHFNLGNALESEPEKAVGCYRNVLSLKPDFAEAHNNLGAALQELGMLSEARICHGNALSLQPGYAVAQYNLARIEQTLGNWTSAAAGYQRAIDLDPDYAAPHNNLGEILQKQGQLDDAIASYRKALQINPKLTAAQDNLFYALNYHPTRSASEIFEEYRQWNEQHARQFSSNIPAWANNPERQKRLRVGYVSSDFRNHSVIHFVAPLIEQHDKSRFELFCYYNHSAHDAETARIIAAVEHWIPCKHLSDEQLARRIREDSIDILVDLSGHTSGNRLLTFARKPAPVQVSWLGFGYTTGLTAIDYFVGDNVFTPPGSESLFSESLYRLPRAAWCYQPPQSATDPGPLPAERNGYVTFACLSRTERINERMIAAWAEILRRLPTARLRLDSHNLSDADMRAGIEAKFLSLAVPKEQLQIGFTSPVWDVYREVDIALDCFPHNSGTTTFEALWMGVPVITLADRPSVGRLGASILNYIGKPQWIASDSSDYINRAVSLAQDLPQLARARAALRQNMRESPLLDQTGFIRDMEAAYCDMWQRWCVSAQQQKETI
jgi:predicted O-linked N-acetylglucosamine transferase (SPINDLY family)